MPRRARLDVANTPQLVVQCGAEDIPVFGGADDFRRYLSDLQASSSRYGCAIHAYALLPHRVELLVTGAAPGSVPRMMQSLGRRYAQYANARNAKQGACWQGRYRSCPVGGGEYILRAYAHVESSPMRAGCVSDPGAYRWSSYACNGLGDTNPLVVPHPAYTALASRPHVRRGRYRDLLVLSAAADEQEILMHIHQGCAWGGIGFLKRVAAKWGDCPLARPRGRPRKAFSTNPTRVLRTLSPFLLTGSIQLLQTVAAAM